MDPPVVMPLSTVVVGVSQQAVLTCSINSSVLPVVEWVGPANVSGPTLVHMGDLYDSTITIAMARAEHRGVYTCSASNGAGSAIAMMESTLYVVGELPPCNHCLHGNSKQAALRLTSN